MEPNRYFYPRLIDSLQGYDKARFKADLYSGVTVGVIALPLAIAFAIASGAKPEAGIFTAIIAGFGVRRIARASGWPHGCIYCNRVRYYFAVWIR